MTSNIVHTISLDAPELKSVNKIGFTKGTIEYPMSQKPINTRGGSFKIGSRVRISPCDDYRNTYEGFYIGDMTPGCGSFDIVTNDDGSKTLVIDKGALPNPAFLVPELERIVYGYESWWSPIKKDAEVKEITDEEINTTVQTIIKAAEMIDEAVDENRLINGV